MRTKKKIYSTKMLSAIVLTATTLCPLPQLHAATWDGEVATDDGYGLWSEASNWQGNLLPEEGEDVTIPGVTTPGTSSAWFNLDTLTLNTLRIDAGGSLTVTGGGDLSTWKMVIGDMGNGTLTLSYGTTTAGFDDDDDGTGLIVGNKAGSSGLVVIGQAEASDAPTLYVSGNMLVGLFGDGQVVQEGSWSTVTADTLVLAEKGGNGSYMLNEGSLITQTTYVGGWAETGGNATFENTGGTHFANQLIIGRGSSGTDQYTLSGTGSVYTSALTIGTLESGATSSSGTFQQSGGTLEVDGDMILGALAGATGIFTQSGGTAEINTLIVGDQGYGTYNLSGGGSPLLAQRINVGQTGTGTFTQDGGDVTVKENLVISRNGGAQGTYTLSSGTLNTGETHISVQSTKGSFIQNGGTHQTAEVGGTLVLGYEGGSGGSYTLNGGELRSEWERIGLAGIGTFIQNGGDNTATTLVLGQDADSQGDYLLNNGHLATTDTVIGGAGWGQFYQYGGTFTVDNTLTLGESSATGGARLQLSGDAVLTAQNVSMNGQEVYISQSGGTFTIDETLSLISQGKHGGSYLLNSGELNTKDAVICDTGGVYGFQFHQFGGTFTIAETLTLGGSSGKRGAYNLYGGKTEANNEIIGAELGAYFLQTNGSNHIKNTLTLGQSANEAGYYNLSQGALQATNAVIGSGGQGYFTLGIEGATSGGSVTIGDNTNDDTEALVVGSSSDGLLTHYAGSTIVHGDLIVGQKAGGHGYYMINGGSSTSTLDVNGMLYLGNEADATGSFTQNGGSVTVTQGTILGVDTGNTGSYTLNDGTLSTAWTHIGSSGSGWFTQTGGTFTTTGDLLLGTTASGTGTYTQSGGTATANTMTIAHGSSATLTGGTLLVNDSLTNDGLLTLSSSGLLEVGNVFTNTENATLTIDLSNFSGENYISLLNSTADLDGTLSIVFSSGLIQEGTFSLLGTKDNHALESSDLEFDLYDMIGFDGYTYQFLATATGLQLSITSETSAVPAPSSILLLSSALLMLARRRQRSIQ